MFKFAKMSLFPGKFFYSHLLSSILRAIMWGPTDVGEVSLLFVESGVLPKAISGV